MCVLASLHRWLRVSVSSLIREEDGEEGGDEKPVPLDFLRKRFRDKISYLQPGGATPLVGGRAAPRATRLARKGSGNRGL